MKFIKTTIAILSLATAAALLTSNATAAGLEKEIRETAVSRLKALREDLALTPDQKARIRAVVKDHKEALLDQWGDGRSARDAMRKAALDHGPESEEAKAAANALGNVARDRSLLIAKIATEVRPILNEDQLRKFEKARDEFESLIESKLDSQG